MKKILNIVIAAFVVLLFTGQVAKAGDFFDSGNGTATDKKNGLMWQKGPNKSSSDGEIETFNWEKAISFCKDLTFAEHGDWKLPTKDETETFEDIFKNGDDQYFSGFFNSYGQAYIFWTSAQSSDDPEKAWMLKFWYGGSMEERTKIYGRISWAGTFTSNGVRCVRDSNAKGVSQ